MKEYSGSILMNMLFNHKDSLSQFRIGHTEIDKDDWKKDAATSTYYFDIIGYKDICIIGIYNTGTNTNVGHDIKRISDDQMQIISFDTESAAVYFLYRSPSSSTDECDKFYPDTKARQVYFDDGMSLQEKYSNNILYSNSHQDEEGRWRRVFHFTASDFAEDMGKYVYVISSNTHGYGMNASVSDIAKKDSNDLVDCRSEVTLRKKSNGDIIIRCNSPFDGTVIIERKDWGDK